MYNPEDLHGWAIVLQETAKKNNATYIQALEEKIKKQEQEIENLRLKVTVLKLGQRFLLRHVRQSIQDGAKKQK